MIINSDYATLTVSGETEIEFIHPHNYCHVQNLGGSSVKISITEDIIGRSEGVVTIPAGGAASIRINQNIYIYGTGQVNVITNDSAENPFRNAGQGGGGGSTGGTSNYPDLDNLPSINGVTLVNDTSFDKLGIHLLTDDDIENMLWLARSGADADKILSEAMKRYTYPEGFVSDLNSTVINTNIQQVYFNDKAFTAVFKINANGWQNAIGLFGYMIGTASSYTGMYSAYANGDIEIGGVYHYYPIDAKYLTEHDGEIMTVIFADSADDVFVMVNGEIIPSSSERAFKSAKSGNLMLLRSTQMDYGMPRSFDGTVYDIAVFDKFLSRNEAKLVSDKLLGEG